MLSCFSCVRLFAALWTAALQAPLSMGFSGKSPRMDCQALLQGIFPAQGLNPHLLCLLHWCVDSLPLALPGKQSRWPVHTCQCIFAVYVTQSSKNVSSLVLESTNILLTVNNDCDLSPSQDAFPPAASPSEMAYHLRNSPQKGRVYQRQQLKRQWLGIYLTINNKRHHTMDLQAW